MSLQLSTRGRYGVRLMIALGFSYGNGIVLLKDIARGESISEKYLSQIVIPLKAAGLVVSQRGSRGGYALARPPEDMTVRQIVEAIEGEIVPVPCTADPNGCAHSSACAATMVWRRLAEEMRLCLDSFTLSALVEEARRLTEPTPDYEI